MEKVSVISACYNHGEFVGEMVASLLDQTWRDLEIILVDDGSHGETRAALGQLDDPRIRVYHQQHSGPAVARNLAISHAKGEIIMNLDSDDKVAPTFIERCMEQFQRHPDAGIVYSDVLFFGDKAGLFDLPEYSIETMLMGNCIVANACFRREDWGKTGGYSSELTYGYEDYDFWLSIIELGRGVYKVAEPLAFYRTYPDPLMSRSGRRKKQPGQVHAALVQAFSRHKKLFMTCPEIYRYYCFLEEEYQRINLSVPINSGVKHE